MKCKHKNFTVEHEGDLCPVCDLERKMVTWFLVWTRMPPLNEQTAVQKDILERLRGDDWRQAEKEALAVVQRILRSRGVKCEYFPIEGRTDRSPGERRGDG